MAYLNIFLFSILTSLLVSTSATAGTYYVATTGSNSNSCAQAQTISTPKQTLNNAIECLAAGDTLLVRGGNYDEGLANAFPSGTSWTNAVTIANYNGETVWLKPLVHLSGNNGRAIYFGGDVGEAVVNPQYIIFTGINVDATAMVYGAVTLDTRNGSSPHHIRFKDFRLINAAASLTSTTGAALVFGGHAPTGNAHHNEAINVEIEGTGGPYGIYITGNDNLVDGCNIHSVASLGVHIYDNFQTPSRNIVRNTWIHDITESYFFGSTDDRIGGILSLGDDNLFYNNLITNLRLDASFGTPEPYGGILMYSGGNNRRAYNNTIFNVDGTAIRVEASSTNAKVYNNILYQNGSNTVEDSGSSTDSQFNLLGTNPNFVNAAGNDFHLGAGSPAIDTGTTLTEVPADFSGISRPQGAAYDRGCYESGGGGGGSQGPVGWWKFDEISGSVASDSSGNNNFGSLIGSPAWVSGIVSNALSFSGSNRVSLGNPAALNLGTNSMSFALWVNEASALSEYDMPWQKGGSSAASPGFDVELGANGWSSCIADGTNLFCVDVGTETTNQWVHLAFVVDRTAGTFLSYRNGTLYSSVGISGLGSLSGSSSAAVGSSDGGGYGFNGKIDDVRIYNRALSLSEIQALGSGETPPATPTSLSVSPVGPANNNTPTVSGSAVSNSSVKIFSNSSCTGSPVNTGTADSSGIFSIAVSVSDNTSTTFYANATVGGLTSFCSTSNVAFVEDSTPPTIPTGLASSPVGQANNNTPAISGSTEANSSVGVYSNSSCATLVASGAANSSGIFSIVVFVNDNTTTTFYAKATDAAGNSSACSTSSVTYFEDSSVPATPTSLASNPVGPADNNSPSITGATEANAIVGIYTNSSCTSFASSGSANSSGTFSVPVYVADNITTTFYAKATDAAGNSSICSTSNVTYIEVTPPSGPVGWWKFDEASGTSASDSSGNNNSGALINSPTWVSGILANAINFGGSNRVSLGSPSQLNPGTGSWSYAMWVYETSALGEYDMAFSKGGASSANPGFDVELGANQWYGCISDGTTGTCVQAGSEVSGQWIHLAFVVNRSTNQFVAYRNGSQTSSVSIAGFGSLNASNNATVGSSDAGTYSFNGKVDDLRMYNRALSPSEVSTLATPPVNQNFTLANGGSKSVVQGTQVTNSISATLTSGTASAVTFSASGLPSGANASFNPASCSPNCSTTMTITTAGSTPKGSYTVTVTGIGGGTTKTTDFTLTVYPDVVSRWMLDSTSGTTVLDTKNLNPGTLVSGTWITNCKINGCLNYNGTSNRATVPNSSSLNFGTGSFTYSLWVSVTSSSGPYDMPISKGGATAGTPGFNMELGTGSWSGVLADGTNLKVVTFGSQTLSQWVHLVIVVDRGASLAKAYKNGSLITSVSISGFGSVTNSNTLQFSGAGTSYLFKGKIDDIRIYNQVLTTQEVGDLYNLKY